MGQDVGSKTSRITETSESNRSPAALGESLGQGRTLGCIPLQWKCPVHGCSRKMGHPSLCSGDQQVPNSTRSAELYQHILFFLVPKISFWLCWQSFLLDLQHIQRVRAVYSCATTSPTFPSEAQHTSTSSVCFLLSTSRVFVLFRASFLAELPPCWGWLMLGAGSGFYTLPSSSGTCPGGWQLARCASLGFGEGEGTGWECLSFLPAPLGQPGELRSSRDRQKSSFVLRSQV